MKFYILGIFKLILITYGWGFSCEISWLSLDLTDDNSTLVQAMAWCHQATSHYLSQCWPNLMSPYGITRPQWVNSLQYFYLVNSSKGMLPWGQHHLLMFEHQLIPPGQNGYHSTDDNFRSIFVNKECILIKIWLEFVPKGIIDNNPALA